MSFTWYVTFEVQKRDALLKRRSSRETRMFDTEAEAKNFAGIKLNEGLVVFAGTVNPYLPRRFITPRSVADWVANGRQA